MPGKLNVESVHANFSIGLAGRCQFIVNTVNITFIIKRKHTNIHTRTYMFMLVFFFAHACVCIAYNMLFVFYNGDITYFRYSNAQHGNWQFF